MATVYTILLALFMGLDWRYRVGFLCLLLFRVSAIVFRRGYSSLAFHSVLLVDLYYTAVAVIPSRTRQLVH